ncbi:MAG: cytochrome P450 [Deltaproteobacteria bacterium]|nr:cytochrome P450 [Deltaproteobacteria bacterium]
MVEFNPFSWDTHENPYPTYRALRDEAPVYRNEELGFWALSRHDDVLMALRDPRRFSSANGVALEAMGPEAHRVMSFLAMDPPRHDRMRALVSRGFTPRRVRELEPRIRELANRYIDRVIEKGQCDFIDDFAGKLPMDVISEMIGVPQHERDRVRGWADQVVHREEGDPTLPEESTAASGEMLAYFILDVARRRAARGGDTVTDALIAAEIEGDRLSDVEIVGFLFLMSIAGNETTTKLLGNALYWLQHCPDQRAMVDADPRLVEKWVEETLRFDASSQILYRTVTEDVELHGQTMKAGDWVALMIGSANRDERVFPNPDTFDMTRDHKQSLAFGQGTHFCLGASLARLEGRVALEEVHRRLRDFEIDTSGLLRIHSGNVRGYAKMPLRFTSGGSAAGG